MYNTTMYIAILGHLNISKDVYVFKVISLDPLVFVLACETTGGPATTVRWRENGQLLNYEQTQEIVDYEKAKYRNKIKILSSIIASEYTFHASNAVNSAASSFSHAGTYVHNSGQ